MFDGKRHVLLGGLRNLFGKEERGGTFNWHAVCLPREIYADKDGNLCTRPVSEATAVFNKTVLTLAAQPKPRMIPLEHWGKTEDPWRYDGAMLVNCSQQPQERDHCSFDVPDDYMMKATIHVTSETTLTIGFREQENDLHSGYHLVITPRNNEIEVSGPSSAFPRKCPLDVSKPIQVQAFIIGSILECWVNNAYAFSLRAYDYPTGMLSFDVTGGSVRILDLLVKIPDND